MSNADLFGRKRYDYVWGVEGSSRLMIHAHKMTNFDGTAVHSLNVVLRPAGCLNVISRSLIAFHIVGDSVFGCAECLSVEIDDTADAWNGLLDRIDGVSDPKDLPCDMTVAEWNFPRRRDDFDGKCLCALSNANRLIRGGGDVFLGLRGTSHYQGREGNRGYSACLAGDGTTLFSACPNGDRGIAFGNLKQSLMNCGPMLIRLRDGAWKVMLENDMPEYELTDKWGLIGLGSEEEEEP